LSALGVRRHHVFMPDPETEELRLEQLRRKREEQEQARETDQPADERAHERRAERADYLKRKLDERAESEDRVDPEP
jgi:hypothetical protein